MDTATVHKEIDLLRAVIDNLAGGVIVVDMEGRFLLFNPAAEKILGIGALALDPAEWTATYGCFLPDMVTPYPSDQLPLARVLKGEEIVEDRLYIRNPQKSNGVWLSVDGKPLKENQGSIWGGMVVFHDISEKIRAEQRMKVYERLCTALEQTADSVAITDRKGIIEYVNPAFETITGYGRDEVLGKTPKILKSGKHDAEFYLTLWSEVLAGRPFKGTIINKKKSGDLYWSQQTITPVKDTEGNITHFVSVMKDITELLKQKEQEASLRVAREVQQRFYCARVSAPGFDVAGAAVPADETGGDYFDFISLPNGSLCIAIGDVSGHGIGAALVMAETRAYLRSFAASCDNIAELLGRVNRALAADLLSDRFVTLLLCCLDPDTGTLTYASAGHEPGYLLDNSGNILSILKATGPPLGLSGCTTYCLGNPSKLEPGHMLLLVTDGITEAISPDATSFGEARAIEYVRAHRQKPASAIVSGLCETIEVFVGDRSLNDDVAAVVIKAI